MQDVRAERIPGASRVSAVVHHLEDDYFPEWIVKPVSLTNPKDVCGPLRRTSKEEAAKFS